MFNIIKSVIESGRFELTDILKKIDTIWIQGDITDEQKTELEALAREKAVPENTYAPLQEQIGNLATAVSDLSGRVKALESQGSGEPGTVPEEPEDEYPEYVQPTGAHDAYQIGDKITWNGKKYTCKLANCVWNPDAYPAGWEEVVE